MTIWPDPSKATGWFTAPVVSPPSTRMVAAGITSILNFAPTVLSVPEGVDVRSFEDLEAIVKEDAVSIGVIATPAVAAQSVADRMVAAGITSILNFAPTVLTVPDGVDVRKVDLSIELQILAYHEQRKAMSTAEPSDLGPVVESA